MTLEIEHEVGDSGPVPKVDSNPHREEIVPPRDSSCANLRCKKGPDGTRGAIKSKRAKYCSASCRVMVCRWSRPKHEQVEKPKRKRRSDAKYASDAARQKAYRDRHRVPQVFIPQAVKDYLEMVKDRKARLADNRPLEPS
jgi:hypothetical protein